MNSSGGCLSCGLVLLYVVAAGIAFCIGALLALIEVAQWLGIA